MKPVSELIAGMHYQATRKARSTGENQLIALTICSHVVTIRVRVLTQQHRTIKVIWQYDGVKISRARLDNYFKDMHQ